MTYSSNQNLGSQLNPYIPGWFNSPIIHIGRTQLLFATGIERGIHERQVLKYQPSVTSRVTNG